MTTLDKTALDAAYAAGEVSFAKAYDAAPVGSGVAIAEEYGWQAAVKDGITAYLDALSSLPAQAVGVKREILVFDWAYTDPRTGLPAYAGTPEKARKLKEIGVKLTTVYTVNETALAPSQPAAVGERADALWEQLLPLMQVEECPPGDPYKDKVAALALIEAALVHRDQVKL